MEFGDAAVKDTSEKRWMEDAIVETETNRVGRLSYAIGA